MVKSGIVIDVTKYSHACTECLIQTDNTQGGPRSKPLPNYQKIVLNRIKAPSPNEIRFIRHIK